MERTPLVILKEEHLVARHIVSILNVISKSLREKKSISFLYLQELFGAIYRVMEMHHRKEMEIFPFLTSREQISREKLVQVLSYEHDLGYEILTEIVGILQHGQIMRNEKYKQLPFHIDEYSRLMKEHIEKEEWAFFPLIRLYVVEEEQRKLESVFHKIERECNNRRPFAMIAQAKRQYK
jgi:hemerythrin-like domain-containing protein